MSFRPYKPRDVGTTAEVVTRLVGAAGGVKRVAVMLHRSATQVTSYTDPATGDEMSHDQVRRLTLATGAAAAAEDLAALAGGVFLPCPADGETFDELCGESAKGFGELTAELIHAHRNDGLDRINTDAMRRRFDVLLRELGAARAKLIKGGDR